MNVHSARSLKAILTDQIYFMQYTLYVYNVVMIWDEDKREKVIRERNIDFANILDIFDDPLAVDFQDLEHTTSDETRYKIIGMTVYYGLITLVYTISDTQDRFITAWKSDEWETNEYEQNRKWK